MGTVCPPEGEVMDGVKKELLADLIPGWELVLA